MHGITDWDGSNLKKITQTLTESTASRWNLSGIFSQDSPRCSSVKKSNVYCWEKVRHQRISQEESYVCRCSTTFRVDQKTMKNNVWPMRNSFLCMQRDLDWKRTMVIYWSWFWKEVVVCHWRPSTRSMGQYGWKDVVGIRRKWLSNFPRYEPIVQRSTQKQRTWKIVDTPCSRFGYDWNYFSHNGLCKSAQSLRSNPFMKERRDPLWWCNQVPHSC